jgi:predicted Fe-Mo cluster-binding NifX family protein
MKFAVSIWNGRIAPVFDVSERCLVIEGTRPGDGGESIALPMGDATARADFLESLGVSALVCGAISRECEEALLARGIETVSFVAGPIEKVLLAWRAGILTNGRFSMPGCGCPRRRRCGNGHGHGHGNGRSRGPSLMSDKGAIDT